VQEELQTKCRKFLEKSHLPRENIKAFLGFTRKYQHWIVHDRNCVIFLNESKINRCSLDGRI
jgi:hypothetical protein